MKDENNDKKQEEMPKDDIVVDNTDTDLDDSVLAEENAVEAVKKLREKLKIAVAEKQEYLNGWQRARADYANFKKETEENKKDIIKFANERLFDELLPALDSFDMAMGNKENWEKVDKNWRIGVEYIYGQIIKALDDNGLSQFSPKVGDTLDTLKHDPIGTIPTEKESDDHKIAEIMKRGYMLGGQVFRPAQVRIFEYKNNKTRDI